MAAFKKGKAGKEGRYESQAGGEAGRDMMKSWKRSRQVSNRLVKGRPVAGGVMDKHTPRPLK
jgi:hypothetical protein